MKLQYTGSESEAQRLWTNGSKDDFLDHIYARTQVTHELGEAILFDTMGNQNFMTVYDPDGSMKIVEAKFMDLGTMAEAIKSTDDEKTSYCGPEAAKSIASMFGDLGNYKSDGRESRRWKLEEIFDDVFLAAIESGLLVEKAVKKACEAVEGIEQIEAARNRVVVAQLNKEFSDDEN